MNVERVEEADGLRVVTVAKPRITVPDVLLHRLTIALESDDVSVVLQRMPEHQRKMAYFILRQGRGRWRRWSTVSKRRSRDFVPLTAELTVLPELLGAGAISLRESWSRSAQAWRPSAFRSEPAALAAVFRTEDPDAIREQLEGELDDPTLLAALATGPQTGFNWRAFAFVLRAAALWHEYEQHGTRPRARELAGRIEHTKYWTPARERLFTELLGRPWDDLIAAKPRQLRIKGPIENPQASLWAESILSVPLAILEEAQGIVCVENHETFDHLLPHSGRWILLQVPGGPPPAECELLVRLRALAGQLPVYAAFDPDPAGIRIALTLMERTGVSLDPTLMAPASLDYINPLKLTDWDRTWLSHLHGSAGSLEPLRAEIAARAIKGEQETLHSWLDDQIGQLTLTGRLAL